MDIVNQKKRSEMMSGIGNSNTKPEIEVRSLLHRAGFRYRLHDRKLPGTPDIVLPRHKAVIEVRGCFWHRHECHLFKWPSTREQFWREKLQNNFERDERNKKLLLDMDYRVFTVWECAVMGRMRRTREELTVQLDSWIRGNEKAGELKGE